MSTEKKLYFTLLSAERNLLKSYNKVANKTAIKEQ